MISRMEPVAYIRDDKKINLTKVNGLQSSKILPSIVIALRFVVSFIQFTIWPRFQFPLYSSAFGLASSRYKRSHHFKVTVHKEAPPPTHRVRYHHWVALSSSWKCSTGMISLRWSKAGSWSRWRLLADNLTFTFCALFYKWLISNRQGDVNLFWKNCYTS